MLPFIRNDRKIICCQRFENVELKIPQVHGIVVVSNQLVRVVFHRELDFKYPTLLERINLSKKESKGRMTKLLKQINKKGAWIYDFTK